MISDRLALTMSWHMLLHSQLCYFKCPGEHARKEVTAGTSQVVCLKLAGTSDEYTLWICVEAHKDQSDDMANHMAVSTQLYNFPLSMF